ncbi:MAG: hypothetical protein LBB93_02105, partial [Elusimicrobiota bacterium]|jgi:hypothetical protein|nr:hypothetical protein [Elusimicrobiota bacterium]
MGGNTAGLAIDLCKQAEGLAVGNIAKQRCRENINGLQDWVNDKPTRDKESRVAKELEQLMLLVDEYSAIHDTVKTSVSSQALAIYSFLTIPDNSYYKTMAVHSTKLLLAAKPYLNTIKYVLGSSDKLYIATSSDIASIAQGIYIAELNELCSLLEVYKDNRNFIILLFQKCLEETKKSMLLIEKMDLDPSFQARYLKNKQNIIGDGGNKDSGSGGCLVIIAMIIVFFLIYLLS